MGESDDTHRIGLREAFGPSGLRISAWGTAIGATIASFALVGFPLVVVGLVFALVVLCVVMVLAVLFAAFVVVALVLGCAFGILLAIASALALVAIGTIRLLTFPWRYAASREREPEPTFSTGL